MSVCRAEGAEHGRHLGHVFLPLLLVGQRLKAMFGDNLLLDFGLKALVVCISHAVTPRIVVKYRLILSRSLNVIYNKSREIFGIFRRKVLYHVEKLVS